MDEMNQDDKTVQEFFYLTAPPKNIILKESLGIGARIACTMVLEPEGSAEQGGPKFRIPCRIETGTIVRLSGMNGPERKLGIHIVGLVSPYEDYGSCQNCDPTLSKEDHLAEHVRRMSAPMADFYFEVHCFDFSWASYTPAPSKNK